MSDFTDLFLSPSDPKYLSLTSFIQKEETNLGAAVQKLPVEVQPFVNTTIASAETLGSVIVTVGGTALGALLNSALPGVEAVITNLLNRAGASAATPAGQNAAQTIETALVALVNQLVNQAVAGIGAPAPTPPAPPPIL